MMRRGWGRPLLKRRLAGGLAGCLLLAALASGCTSARNSLGTSDSSCYLALPAAERAVHGHGHLEGVHLFSLAALRQKAPHLYRTIAPERVTSRVCVVAFDGFFTTSSVSDPRGRSAGRLAVVVATTPANRLLGTVIFVRPPLHFGHSHVG